MVVATVGRGGGGGVRRVLGVLFLLLAPQQQDDNSGDEADEEDKTCEAHQHGQGGGVGGLSARTLQQGPLQERVTVGGPRLALADHHAVCSVQSDVLDVGSPVVFDTDVLGQSRAGESRGSAAVAAGGYAGDLGLLDRGYAVMEVLHTAFADIAVGIFSGADSVDGVDEPLSTSSHLEKRGI